MRYDPEIAVAQMVADYLSARVDGTILALCPAVTFFDPMSIDEANRMVVMVPSVETAPDAPGNFTAHVECGLKSQWAQPTLYADMAAHFNRVNEFRDKLMPKNLQALLEDYALAGLALEHVQPRKSWHTSIRDKWFYSEMSFVIQCYATGTAVSAEPKLAGEIYMSGNYPLVQGETSGSVTGLGLSFAPSKVIPSVVVPEGGDAIAAFIMRGTVTADGFSFALNAAPDSDQYALSYLILP